MDPEDLPELPQLDDVDLDLPDDLADPDPLIPAVDPIDPDPVGGPGSDVDLGGLSDLPDLPDQDWAPPPAEPDEARPAQPADPIDLGGTVPPDPNGPAPVELELDGDLLGDPHIAPEAASPAVDLSLDPEQEDSLLRPDGEEPADGEESGDAGTPELPEQVELPLDASLVEPYEVADANSWLTPGLIAAAVVAMGVTVPGIRRLIRSAPVDFAAQLDELGIDARVEHLDLTGLEELLVDGRSVLLSTDGTAGVDSAAVVQVRSVDRRNGSIVVVDDRATTFTIDVERFEAAWSDSANQVVVASGSGGGVALVPVTLGRADLVAAR